MERNIELKKQLLNSYSTANLLTSAKLFLNAHFSEGIEALKDSFDKVFGNEAVFKELVYYVHDQDWDTALMHLENLSQKAASDFLSQCAYFKKNPQDFKPDLFKVFCSAAHELSEEIYDWDDERLRSFYREISRMLVPIQGQLGADFFAEFFVSLKLGKMGMFLQVLTEDLDIVASQNENVMKLKTSVQRFLLN